MSKNQRESNRGGITRCGKIVEYRTIFDGIPHGLDFPGLRNGKSDRLYLKKHTFEEILDNPADKSATSSYKTLKLIDLIKGCLNPKTNVNAWNGSKNLGYWVQYKIPDAKEGQLFMSLFYCRKPGVGKEHARAIQYCMQKPGIAAIMPDGPLREIVQNVGDKVAIDLKHIVVDGEHLNVMCVLGKGWQLDSMDKRAAKVIMLLLGLLLEVDDGPIIWAKYSIWRLITDLLGYDDQAQVVPGDGITSRNIVAQGLANIEPVITLEEILA
jgi:hypothetical protein